MKTLTIHRFGFRLIKCEKGTGFAEQLQSLTTSGCALSCTAALDENQAQSQRTMLAFIQAIVHQSISGQPYVTSGYHLCFSTKPHLKGIYFPHQC